MKSIYVFFKFRHIFIQINHLNYILKVCFLQHCGCKALKTYLIDVYVNVN